MHFSEAQSQDTTEEDLEAMTTPEFDENETSVYTEAPAATPENRGKCKYEPIRIDTVSKPTDCDNVAKLNDKLIVHYTGKLASGQKIDSSR